MPARISAIASPCLALSILSLAAIVQTDAVPVSIIAIDQSGARVQGVQVQLTPAPDPVPGSMETDAQGKLTLTLKPDTYQVIATRVGFFDFTTQFDVKASGELRNLVIRLKQSPKAQVRESVNAVPSTLRVSAAPYHEEVTYKAADLQSLPRTTVTIHNAHTGADETYSGVRVADILAPLGVPLGKDLRANALTVGALATGSDGYQAVLALAEIDHAFHPGEVIVADTLNGKPLDADSGPFRLIVSEDKRPARSVRNLVSIELKSVK